VPRLRLSVHGVGVSANSRPQPAPGAVVNACATQAGFGLATLNREVEGWRLAAVITRSRQRHARFKVGLEHAWMNTDEAGTTTAVHDTHAIAAPTAAQRSGGLYSETAFDLAPALRASWAECAFA
jgi:hypothetical protein